MSMRTACRKRTICEVLREINDRVQEGTPEAAEIRKRLAEAEAMAKKMQYKLLEYNKEQNWEWWEDNPDYEESLRRRTAETYVTDRPL